MQDSSTIQTLILSPADAAHPGLAVAAARAGGVGVLDFEFARDTAQLRHNFTQLLAATVRQSAGASIGLRLSAGDLGCVRELMASAGERALTLVLHGDASRMASLARTLRQDAPRHRLLAEITHPGMVEGLTDVVDGLIAKGHEAGAWVGEDTSYILAQKLIGKTTLPLWLRGGIGRHSAAATAMMGAAGVVLDDQVLLLTESPLHDTHKLNVARLNGAETQLFGEQIDMPCRVFGARGSTLLERIKQASRQAEAGQLSQADWREELNQAMGWGKDQLLPIGQGIGLAALYRDQYRSVGRLIQALQAQLNSSRSWLAQNNPLAENSPLAASHGTRFPIAQGPMTRVSDSPAFADAVAQGGALPFLALALMRGEQVDELLAETTQMLGDKPWGVGILGFVPQALREEQCAAVFRHKPSYALIAGGRPDQAAEFEQRGIPAYLHAPAPALLKLYLEQGARRFVFEGRECGGHIGPIASFPLWEQMIEVLLNDVSDEQAQDVHVFFAGGINDARSSAMIAALAAPLVERGMKVGVLMGTAYLFTHEIVETGAIVPGFQREALACTATCSLETGPGHSTRCADTEFSREFFRQRRALLQSDKSADDIRDELEDLNMGRLRVASKGRDRDATGQIVELDDAAQKLRGMYMIGQVATLHDKVLGVEELHRNVSDGAGELLADLASRDAAGQTASDPSDIAIVGIGMILPQIDNADDFWGKVLRLETTITEVPKDRWDEALYFDPDKNARDKVYSRWGGFLDEVVFDPASFGIAPSSMKSIDPMQLLSLECTARALRDAGMGPGQADFDREHTSIILGAGGGIGDLGMQLGLRSELPRFVEDPEDAVWDRLPEWTNESFAGVLLNVTAGRIANRLDFGGVNFTVDAACGSSLAAITLATQELESGRSNVAIAGGVDTVQGPFGYLCFSKTQALSPQGKARTFDRDADGIVISEGVCVTVMKRLADAERDGDRIYAVIKAASGSSDGRALGMTAPLPKGQQRALNRAYSKAGFSPASLGMVEAHGTGTAVGDRAEAETVTSTLIEAGADVRSVALGSVKTLVGHTKCAAGVTGLVKTALSLHHRVLPGHAGVDNPIDVIADDAAPTYLLKQPRPWLRDAARPRRAAVSAFGFGGTNFHAVLEEYRTGWGADAPVGANQWPVELFVFRAADQADLEKQLGQINEALDQPLRADASLTAIAAALVESAERASGTVSLSFVAGDLNDLRARVGNVLHHLHDGQALSAGTHLNLQRPQSAPKLGVLFPGQGAQYVGMLRAASLYLPQLREAWEQADELLAPELGEAVSAIAWPAAAFDSATESAQRARLTDTRHAQPALGASELGLWRWLSDLGLRADAVGGHSYGEYTALMAAGVLSADDFLRLSAARGRVMAEAAQSEPAGTMAAVLSERDQVESLIKDIKDVSVANHNAPKQSVITGSVQGIETALAACEAAGVTARKLPVGGAFHSPLMSSAQAGLSQAIDAAQFQAAQCAVYSNMTGARYPDDMAAHLKQHLLSSVEFVKQVETMQAEGVELFLELGPKTILGGMLRDILPQGECLSVDRAEGDLAPLLDTLAQLTTRGFDLNLSALFAGRVSNALNLRQLKAQLAKPALSRTAWMVAGGYARPAASDVRSNGVLEALSQADKDQAIARRRAQASVAPPAAIASPAAPSAASSHVPQLPIAGGAVNGDALVAYQDTMRQFLKLQEAVMAQALGYGDASALPAPESLNMPTFAPPVSDMAAPAAAAAAPQAQEHEAAAPAVPAVAAAPALDVSATLLGIVAERTGYPEDMLDVQADLEADLGIDSIKRVEIVGALQKALPETVASAMQADLETYTRAKTLAGLIDAVSALVGTQPAAAPAAPAVAEAPALDVSATLLGIVAERTGYPEDMLDVQADLEADLGIDSIKRVEIVGALQKALPETVASAMQADLETYTRAKTLAGLIDAVSALVGTQPAAVPAAPAATEAAALDVSATLLGIVAERTGYPEDMLDVQADLEADLGIDSIKRVEIVGALQKALPETVASAMQADLETYTRAKTLAGLIDAVSALVGTQPAAVPAAPAATEAAALDVSATLLGIVAERTGYPEDMLDVQADLEADLGIDSIKRVEIVGALQKALPETVASAMQADLETYTRAKTLQILIDAVTPLLAQAPAVQAVAAAPVPSTEVQTVSSSADVPAAARYVIRPRQAALPNERKTPTGLVIVVDGPDRVRESLVERISATGATPVELLMDEPRALKSELEVAVKAHGPVRAVLHLGGLSEHPEETFAQWRKTGANTVGKLFTLLKALGDERESLHLIAATRLGGTLGREAGGAGSALAGGAAGMINCYRQEYPQSVARLIDFNGQTDEVIAELLFDELCSTDPHREIGYLGDTRYTVSTQEHPLHDHAFAAHLEPQDGWVVLATGGARGITAEILLQMAKPGLRYVLIGRTPLPDPNDLHLEHATALHLKGALIADARVNGNMPKPAELDQRVAQIMAGREVLNNVQRMRDAGVEVEYLPCDVRDVASFAGAIEDVYSRLGRIDGVIHGAGVIEDKLIADKTAVSFDRVFGTKTDSAWILANALKPDTLKWIAFFTSVAGRYGNRGQSDYAAANEALNRYAWQLSRRWKETRVMAINWGPWDAGMASDAVKAKFREQGILPIPVEAGARYFLDELAYGPKSEVELVVGEGPWAAYDGEQEADENNSDLPLIRAGLHIGAGGTLVLDHHFTTDSDPYLLDHSMDGKPVLPAAGAVEWMAQVAAAGWPGWQVAEVRDLKVLAGVVLDPARGRKVAFKARASTHSQPGEQMLAIEIVDPERNQALYKAKVRLVERLPEPPQLDAVSVHGEALDATAAYRDFLFHGGDFQLIDQISVVAREGVDAQAKRSRPAVWLRQDGVTADARWLFDPGLIDCGPQLAIVWSRRFLDKTALPSAFGSVCRYGRDPLPDRLSLYLRIRGEASESSLNYDVLLADEQGRVRLEMCEVEGTASAALNRLASADA